MSAYSYILPGRHEIALVQLADPAPAVPPGSLGSADAEGELRTVLVGVEVVQALDNGKQLFPGDTVGLLQQDWTLDEVGDDVLLAILRTLVSLSSGSGMNGSRGLGTQALGQSPSFPSAA